MFFAVLAVAGQIERTTSGTRPSKARSSPPAKGNHGGRPKVINDDMLTFALASKDKGVVPIPDTAKKLTPSRPGRTRASPRPSPPLPGAAEADQGGDDADRDSACR